MRHILGSLALSLVLAAGSASAAEEYGSAEEAKAMLQETVSMMESDKEGTIEKINQGEMMDRDLYPYCGNMEGQMVAHPSERVREMSLKGLTDKTGKAFGEEIYEKAEAGETAEVSYMWPRPDEEEPVEKVAYVTKVDDMICGVGYYK